MRTLTSILAILFTLVTAVRPVAAQTSSAPGPAPTSVAPSATVSQAALDAAVQEHVESTGADRAAVVRVLQLPGVKAVAGRMGVDLRTAEQAVATADGPELGALRAQAGQVEQALAGGQSKVVISTTTIIIGLLVLILLIVALD